MIFAGWFGPVGIAALYYALHAEKETGNSLVWPLTALIICASVFTHGINAAPFSRILKKGERRRA
jgi:sodium/hydrogen antiporter